MSRHPLGEVAMSNAERQRRHRAKLAAEKPSPSSAFLAEIARLQTMVADLETANMVLKEKLAALKQEAERSKQEARRYKDASDALAGKLARLQSGKGFILRSEYRKLEKCFHPDIVRRFNDPDMTKRFTEAAQVCSALKPFVTQPK